MSVLLKTTSNTLRISLKSFSNTSVIKRVYFLQLRSEKQHLESELERAERESAIYVTEVREVRKKNPDMFSFCDSSPSVITLFLCGQGMSCVIGWMHVHVHVRFCPTQSSDYYGVMLWSTKITLNDTNIVMYRG